MSITYENITTNSPVSDVASVIFSNIPGTYTDLVLISQVRVTGGTQDFWVRFNGDTATNYSSTFVYGDGTSALGTRNISGTGLYHLNAYTSSSGMWSIGRMNIQNYANTTTLKSVINRADSAGFVVATAGLWRKSPAEAITSITLLPSNSANNIVAGSVFTLYGIKSE